MTDKPDKKRRDFLQLSTITIGAAGTAAGITTSNYELTTNAAGIPKWTTTIDGGSF